MAFRDPSTMRKHIKRHNPDRPYKCETCGKGFASSYDVKKHARIHMNNEERPYKCEVRTGCKQYVCWHKAQICLCYMPSGFFLCSVSKSLKDGIVQWLKLLPSVQ